MSDVFARNSFNDGMSDAEEDVLESALAQQISGEATDFDLGEVPPIPETLPILPMREALAYPHALLPILVGQERSIRLVRDAVRGDRLIGVVAQRRPDIEGAGPDDLFSFGTVARIQQLARHPQSGIIIAVLGLEKIRLLDFVQTQPYLVARVEVEHDEIEQTPEVEALSRSAVDLFDEIVPLVGLSEELSPAIRAMSDPLQIAYLISSSVRMSVEARQQILEARTVGQKLRHLVETLSRELEIVRIGEKIRSQTQDRMTQTQREFILREQMREIQKELGEGGDGTDVDDLRRRITAAELPSEAQREAHRELDRLARVPSASPEYGMIRTYLDWLASLPWTKLTGGAIEVERARAILDEDHYDLEKIKDRIVEHLAVRKLRQDRQAEIGLSGAGDAEHVASAGPLPTTPTNEDMREPILCFVGPPGVGKTSLGQSIARSMGRQFVRISLGGVRDEADIRGHRRTYVGALPGRIIQGLRRVETADPVFMLDEIDKLAVGFQGDPAAALLEVLDPAQNHTFADHYLGVPFDLTRVMFITTANTVENIPEPLRDRMEILPLSGYTDDEKIAIAQRYLVPKQLRAHGLRPGELAFADDALRRIAREYTREAGVRNLEREIATICRKTARGIAEGKPIDPRVDVETVQRHLGRPKFTDEVAARTDRPGVATGLAWTPSGGDVLFVEVAMVPATEEKLTMTGMLGDVMQESARAALTFVRARGDELGVDPAQFVNKGIHIHVPSGAIPKDGPSAGVTIATALVSLATGRPVRPDVAMTGEITLGGTILPVGGIKEKTLAAHRNRIGTIILPRRNERDLDDVPAELRDQIHFVFADDATTAIATALEDQPVLVNSTRRTTGGSRHVAARDRPR
jgi:ATP-dependent Lon protease